MICPASRGTILAENVGGNCKHVANAGNNISDDDTCGFGNQTGANGRKIGDNSVDPQLTNLGIQRGSDADGPDCYWQSGQRRDPARNVH